MSYHHSYTDVDAPGCAYCMGSGKVLPGATCPTCGDVLPTEAYLKGRQWGAHFRNEGRDYGLINGSYPSCPYHVSDPRCAAYTVGYEAGFDTPRMECS